jgi:RNA 2',3'-cyclic 3'-phosphodiesterase
MRLFVAMEFDEPFWQRLVDLQEELRKVAPDISYTRPENFHLTLKFIGAFEEAKLPALCDSLRNILKVGEFPMTLTGLDFLPERGPIRIIGAAVNGGGKLEVLQRLIDVACARHGVPLDKRRYRPHITLARARHTLPRSAKAQLASCYIDAPIESMVMDFVLMESKLSKDGAGYTPLQHVYTS